MKEQQITPEITIGGQPHTADIKALKERGFQTVINLRAPDEKNLLEDEKRLVEESGMDYASIPVTPQLLDEAAVHRFATSVAPKSSQPVYVHCGSGGRAGLLALLHLAIDNGWTVEQALQEGEKHGISPSERSPYRRFFEEYIQRRSAGAR
jgi:uncharacterized protein (TIGR01244 family)